MGKERKREITFLSFWIVILTFFLADVTVLSLLVRESCFCLRSKEKARKKAGGKRERERERETDRQTKRDKERQKETKIKGVKFFFSLFSLLSSLFSLSLFSLLSSLFSLLSSLFFFILLLISNSYSFVFCEAFKTFKLSFIVSIYLCSTLREYETMYV